jgi:hypothetical protein
LTGRRADAGPEFDSRAGASFNALGSATISLRRPSSRKEKSAMKSFGKSLLVIVAAAIFAIAAVQGPAQEKQKKQGKKGAKKADAVAKMLEGIDLSAEQQVKVDQIKKEYAPKLAQIEKRRSEVMTPDRRKTEREIRKAAKDAGKKGKETKAEVEAALKLSPSEREQLAVVQKEDQTLRAEINERLRDILTPDQKAKLPEPAKKKHKQK